MTDEMEQMTRMRPVATDILCGYPQYPCHPYSIV